jgi:NTE family protein
MQRGVYRSNRQKSVLARFGGRNYERAAARIQQALQASQSPVVARIRTRFSKKPIPGLIEVLLSSLHIMQARIAESRLQIEKPDLLIRPSLSSVHLLEFDRADELIEMGYRSAIGPIRELARQLL